MGSHVAHQLIERGKSARVLLRRGILLSTLSVRLMHIMSPMDHGNAEREFGWHPERIHHSIRKAVEFYRGREAAHRTATR